MTGRCGGWRSLGRKGGCHGVHCMHACTASLPDDTIGSSKLGLGVVSSSGTAVLVAHSASSSQTSIVEGWKLQYNSQAGERTDIKPGVQAAAQLPFTLRQHKQHHKQTAHASTGLSSCAFTQGIGTGPQPSWRLKPRAWVGSPAVSGSHHWQTPCMQPA